MFKIIFNLVIAFIITIFILESTSVIRPFSESLIRSGYLPPIEPGSFAPGIIDVLIMVLQGILVSLEPVFNVLMDIIFHLINIVLTIQITMTGLIYFLVIFFLLSYLYEKYRRLVLHVNKIEQDLKQRTSSIDLARALEESENHVKKLIKNESSKKNKDLLEQATLIKDLLLKINTSIETDDRGLIDRAKKSRRAQVIDKPKPKLKSKVKSKPKPKPKVKSKPKPKAANVIEDENISNIDLARALIESKDIKKAREILIKVAESGNESEVHEAKLLYLQLK